MKTLKTALIIVGVLLSLVVGMGVSCVVVIPAIMNGASIMPSILPLVIALAIIWGVCIAVYFIVKVCKKEEVV